LGLGKVNNSYESNKVSFKRNVPAFNDIDDVLIASTIETLVYIIFEAKIYEDDLNIPKEDSIKLYKCIDDNKRDSIFDIISRCRKIQYDLWKDVFSKYFIDAEIIKQAIHDFINNRNHIAHNKPLVKSAADKMKRDMEKLDAILRLANDRYSEEEPSEELYHTWLTELASADDENEVTLDDDYAARRIYDETGIKIRNKLQIFDLFMEMIDDLHTIISEKEYFNYAVEVSPIMPIERTCKRQMAFSIKCNANESFSFNIFVDISANEGQGEESYLQLYAIKDDSILFESDIDYRNGEAHEDPEDCIYVPDMDSDVDQKAFDIFIEELIDYISNRMNPVKQKIDDMKYEVAVHGGEADVADFPCTNCGEEYISLNDEIYPYGYCINCGEENEIHNCLRCGCVFGDDDGDGEFCNSCIGYINQE
jgi:hypothetical protein